MRNMCIIIEYQGTSYCGWQIQPNGISVQQKLQEAIQKVSGQWVTVHGSGRTDAGVHARGQCASFLINSQLPAERWPSAINAYLPEDICVVSASEEVKDFHARYSALGKQYSYQLHIHPQESPLMRLYAWHLKRTPDLVVMENALSQFRGTHDFSGFRAAKRDGANPVRTIWESRLIQEKSLIRIVFQGNGFLYKMVRMMVAATVQAGLGKIAVEDIVRRLQSGAASYQKLAAPPQGLFLDQVYYDPQQIKSLMGELG